MSDTAYSQSTTPLSSQTKLELLNQAIRFKPVWIMSFLGFSAGLPLALVFVTLSNWLNEVGVSKSTITLFSWAALGYSIKFFWAPLIDRVKLPFIARLGQRRSWLLITQLAVTASIIGMAMTDPSQENALYQMAFFAVCLGFASASQDIVIDAFRIECADASWQGFLTATYSCGYRVALIISGALCLFLSEIFGSQLGNYSFTAWSNAYLVMAAFMAIGIATTFLIKEPQTLHQSLDVNGSKQLVKLFFISLLPVIGFYQVMGFVMSSVWVKLVLAMLSSYVVLKILHRKDIIKTDLIIRSYYDPVSEFINRYPIKTVVIVLLLIGLYRISDMVLGTIANVYYQDMGFTKSQISVISKTLGIGVTLASSLVFGIVMIKVGVIRLLFVGAISAALTNFLFILLAYFPGNSLMLGLVILLDNIAAGLASIAFVAFLSRLTNIQFTATQYAIFSSLMQLIPRLISGASGGIIDAYDYPTFFIFTALLGVPVIYLVYLTKRELSWND